MGRTGFELVKGYTPDISLYLAHDWYDYVWWLDLQDKSWKLGRWLGPAGLQFGGGDCHFVITSAAKVHVTNATSAMDRNDSKRLSDEFLLMDKEIWSKIGDPVKEVNIWVDGEWDPTMRTIVLM